MNGARDVIYIQCMKAQGYAIERTLIAGEGGFWIAYKPAEPEKRIEAFDVSDLFNKWLDIPEVLATVLGVDTREL